MVEDSRKIRTVRAVGPTSDEVERALQIGIEKAKERARNEGLEVGQKVAHEDNKLVYALKKIDGNEAVVWLPGKENSVKRFPLNEIFDPNHANEEAQKALPGIIFGSGSTKQ